MKKRLSMKTSRTEDELRNMDGPEFTGWKYAMENEFALRQKVQTHDRFTGSHGMLNMIYALSMHPWLNTVADWQRKYEAMIIMDERRKKSRGTSGLKRGRDF